MPTELTQDVSWINESHRVRDDTYVHVSAYVVDAPEGPVMIDTGSFHDRAAIERGVDEVAGDESLAAIILTHADLPHSGNLDTLREKYSDARIICGSSSPDIVGLGTSEKSPAGGQMTIAGREFNFVYPPLADIQHSSWIHDQESKVLFTADGFGNYHDLDDAAKTTAEMDDISTIETLREFHRSALLWLQYVHPPTLVDELTSLFERYDVSWIAPIHGNPIAAGDREEYLARLEQAITDIN